MNLIALLIGLVIERLATQWFHWRRMRWLDRIIDRGFAVVERVPTWPVQAPIILLAILLVLPAVAVFVALGGTLAGFTYLLLAIVLLFFSFGPHDIGEDVDDYCEALTSEDEEAIQHTANAIIEGDMPEDPLARVRRVEEFICIQANNRLFAVIFWFIVLGPLAAWAYRVTDLIRRRAVFNASRSDPDDEQSARVREAAETLHGWLAWIPARLSAVAYATAGNFDEAIAAMRAPGQAQGASTSEHSEKLLARVGVAAMALQDEPDETIAERGIRGATAARRLVFRQLMIWTVVIAAMTLYGLTQ